VAVFIIVFLLFIISQLAARKRTYRAEKDSLMRYLKLKKPSYISNIILNLDRAIKLETERTEEDGIRIYIFDNSSEIPYKLLDHYCSLTSSREQNDCINHNSQIIRIKYPLMHAGTEYGYLIAEKKFSYQSAWLNSSTLLFISLVMLFVYLGVVATIYKQLDRRIIKPLQNVVDSLKPLSKGNYNVIFRDYQSREMSDVASQLQTIIKRAKNAQEKMVEFEKDAVIGRMASQIAHDIRSPLSMVQYYVKSDHSEWDRDTLLKFTKDASECLNKLTTMSDELLNFSKANRIEKRNVNFNELISRTVNELKASIRNKEITIEYNQLDDSLVFLDEVKINRALSNLISNSVEAISDKGKIEIHSKIERNGLMISLKDTGCGIASNHLSKLFSKEFTFGKKKGTGLGLAYSQSVIKAHGGDITVKSELDQGTEFLIKIPNQK